MKKHKAYKLFFATIILIFVCILIYGVGLNGGYLLDDIRVLPNLHFLERGITLENIKHYIGHSDTGPLKRPISVLSFMLDSQQWPTSPYSFKRTNLIIHIVNGILLFSFLLQFLKLSKQNSNTVFIAFVITALWLFHPFLVSTVLYIVQRMVLLSAFFILVGMNLYMFSRIKYANNPDNKTYQIYMIMAVYFLTALSVLSKENGILLIFFIALVENYILVSFLKMTPLKSGLKFWLIRLPVAILIVAIGLKAYLSIPIYEIREFSLFERMISQPQIVFTYLSHIFIPKYLTEGIFTDGIIAAKDIWSSPFIILSIVLIVVLGIIAYKKRKSSPLLSFTIAFFLIAHILESSIFPLELYFEHRNYIPMFFVFLPITLVFFKFQKHICIIKVIALGLIAVMILMAFLRASMWGSNRNLFENSMDKFPYSIRAVFLTVQEMEKDGEAPLGLELLNYKINQTQNLSLMVLKGSILCRNHRYSQHFNNSIISSLNQKPVNKDDLLMFGNLIYTILDACNLSHHASFEYSSLLVQALENNPTKLTSIKKPIQDLLQAKIKYNQKDYMAATLLWMSAFNSNKDYSMVFIAIMNLLKNDRYQEAEMLLQTINLMYNNDFRYKVDWLDYQGEFEAIKQALTK